MSTEHCTNSEVWRDNQRMVVRMETPMCTQDQARTAITNFLDRANIHDIKWFMNYGTDRDTSYKGFVLVWFGGEFESAYKAYNLILGRNVDGSHRYEYSPSQECERIEAELEELICQSGFSWADAADLEDLLSEQYGQNLNKYRGPAVKLPTFRLNTEQSQKLNARWGNFKITPIFTHEKTAGEGRNGKALFAQRVPASLSANFINGKMQEMCHGNYNLVEGEIKSGRCISIYFESSGDCNLIRTMFRSYYIRCKRNPGFFIVNYCFNYREKPKSPKPKTPRSDAGRTNGFRSSGGRTNGFQRSNGYRADRTSPREPTRRFASTNEPTRRFASNGFQTQSRRR